MERNGQFWVEGLALTAGSHTMTVTATDAAGNVSARTLTVSRRNVDITINPVNSNLLNAEKVTLTGTISVTDHTVWVNGVRATMNGNAWTATDVPINPGGTAVFEARAIPNNEIPSGDGTIRADGVLENPTSPGPKDLGASQEKEPFRYVSRYEDRWNDTLTDSRGPVPRDKLIAQNNQMLGVQSAWLQTDLQLGFHPSGWWPQPGVPGNDLARGHLSAGGKG